MRKEYLEKIFGNYEPLLFELMKKAIKKFSDNGTRAFVKLIILFRKE